MSRQKMGEGEITDQESIRFEDEKERLILNKVLSDIRTNSDGTITKVRFFKTLMGIRGYSIRALTQKHRHYLSGALAVLPEQEHGTLSPDEPIPVRKSGSDKRRR